MKLQQQLRLCLITNIREDLTSYAQLIRKAIKGGVTMVQLREKDTDLEEVKNKALFLKEILQPFKVPLIINDFVELAAQVDADGVHIGNQDMSAKKARAILGPNKIIGVSIESFEDLANANNQADISYVTASAVFPSSTKPDCKTIWGLNNLQKLASKSTHPMTAIGGITTSNAGEVFNAGACGIAVIGALHDADDPCKEAEKLSCHTHTK